MDMRQLQTIIAVADTGSFAAAARMVNLTASAVSQQIQSLEAELGVTVFDRKRRPPRLNAKGEAFVHAARSVVQTLADAQTAISGSRTAGLLKFGAIRTVSIQFVPAALAEMQSIYPGLSFDLSVGLSETLMADVASGRRDAALVAEHLGVPGGLSWTPVLSEPLVLVSPPAEAERSEAELLRDLPFIRYETDVPLARQIETELSRLGATPRNVAVTNTMPAVIGLVQAGLGVAVVPKIAVLDTAPGTLHCRSFCDGAITRRLGLVQRKVSSRSEVLAELRNVLSDRAARLGLSAAA